MRWRLQCGLKFDFLAQGRLLLRSAFTTEELLFFMEETGHSSRGSVNQPKLQKPRLVAITPTLRADLPI